MAGLFLPQTITPVKPLLFANIVNMAVDGGIGTHAMFRLRGWWSYAMLLRTTTNLAAGGAATLAIGGVAGDTNTIMNALALTLGGIRHYSPTVLAGVIGAATTRTWPEALNAGAGPGLKCFQGFMNLEDTAADGIGYTVAAFAFTAGILRFDWHLMPLSNDAQLIHVMTPTIATLPEFDT
jgi:hypothetical protein